MRVSELKIGTTARIIALSKANPSFRQRLIAMGVLPGTSLRVLGVAPLGDPIEVLVRGVMLSLRKDEADLLRVEVI